MRGRRPRAEMTMEDIAHMGKKDYEEDIQLDKTDRRILAMLAENARTPVKEIAKANYLSSPAVSSRIRRMEESGIIRGYHADIDYALLGYHIRAFINLEVNPKDKAEFYPYIRSLPNVVECSCVTGDYSMLIQVLYQRPEELDHLVNDLQRFGHTKTLIAFSTSVEHRGVSLSEQ